eukprot:TRINITY_DN3634_c0_g2_i1.p1 TRINITY_DN3634_c0_g2~~TRINITY_DN3634_c0_g2_i1.p1  ORF type:complete len:456 (+),score=116.14 TRINITY_DN3634_c0_g2_i1:34-1401(+)
MSKTKQGSNDGDLKQTLKDINESLKNLDARVQKIEKQTRNSGGSCFSFSMAILVLVLSIALLSNDKSREDFVERLKDVQELVIQRLNPDTRLCQNITVYHHERLLSLDLNARSDCKYSVQEILNQASNLFSSSLTQIYTESGRTLQINNQDITVHPGFTYNAKKKEITLDRVGSDYNLSSVTFALLRSEERFIWPAERLGHKFKVTTSDGQKVVVKPVSKQPRLLEIENLMSYEETDAFYLIARNLQKVESLVGADNGLATKSESRSSSHTWIGRDFTDNPSNDLIDRIERRIFELVQWPDEDTAEPFQVVFYNKSQYYYGHHDYTEKEDAPHNPYYYGGGNRFVTVLLYLNDVEEGGETTFPFADSNGNPINRHINPTDMYRGSIACSSGGVRVKPKKGGAAMFYNLKEEGHMDGKTDPYSLHAGCPVTKGEKHISNKWIRNKRVRGKLYDELW